MKTYSCGCVLCDKHHSVSDGWREQNRQRLNERARENYQKNKKERQLAQRERNKKNPEKVRSHNRVNKAVRSGRLIKPNECENCGRSDARLEGHHHKGYEPPNDLDVQWLCRPCHRKADSTCVVS